MVNRRCLRPLCNFRTVPGLLSARSPLLTLPISWRMFLAWIWIFICYLLEVFFSFVFARGKWTHPPTLYPLYPTYVQNTPLSPISIYPYPPCTPNPPAFLDPKYPIQLICQILHPPFTPNTPPSHIPLQRGRANPSQLHTQYKNAIPASQRMQLSSRKFPTFGTMCVLYDIACHSNNYCLPDTVQ